MVGRWFISFWNGTFLGDMFFFCVFPYISSAISVQSCEPGTIGSFFFDLSSTKFPGKTTVFFLHCKIQEMFQKNPHEDS